MALNRSNINAIYENNDRILNFDPEINIHDYLKDISETDIFPVGNVVKDYFSKRSETLEFKKNKSDWQISGIKPEHRYDFNDIIRKVNENPNEEFSVSDVWVKVSKIHIVTKFNRTPNVAKAIKSMDFDFGLNWEALDTPHYYLALVDEVWVLISVIGGHRAVMCILQNGYKSEMPCRVTYIGTGDVELVAEKAARIHHIDCNKRSTQNSNDRLKSGVEARDPEFLEIFEFLCECKLYCDDDHLRSDQIKDSRQCSSWMGFWAAQKEFKAPAVKFACEMLMKHTEDKVILSQAIETIACFRYYFNEKIQKLDNRVDILDEFLKFYFEDLNVQSDLRKEGKVYVDTVQLVKLFNRWSMLKYKRKQKVIPDSLVMDRLEGKISLQ